MTARGVTHQRPREALSQTGSARFERSELQGRLTADAKARKLLEVRTIVAGGSAHAWARGNSRTIACFLVGAVAVLTLASALSSAAVGTAFAASRSSGTPVHAVITGRYSASATSTQPNGTTETQTSSIAWSATVTGGENDILLGKALPKLTNLTGTVSVTGAAEPDCSGSISASTQKLSQGDYQSLLVIYPPGYPAITAPGVGPQSNAGSKLYLVEATIPFRFVVSSVGDDPNSGCSTTLAQDYLNFGPPQGDPQYDTWQKTRHAFASFDTDGHSDAPTITGNVSGAGYQSEAQETLSFGGGKGSSSSGSSSGSSSSAAGGCPSGPTITVNPTSVKANAHTTVTGCNFKHHSAVALVECLETSWTASQKPCETDNRVNVTTSSSGGFRTTMKVDACRGVAPAGVTEDCYIGVVKAATLQPYATIALGSS